MHTSAPQPTELYRDANHVVEKTTLGANTKGLVYTFTPARLEDLDDAGFGTAYFIGRGYDVVAFKCSNDSWYQELPSSLLDDIGQQNTYAFSATYGASMGGYAAIAFAGILRARNAYAFCPQYRITAGFDPRWTAYARRIPNWQYEISPEYATGDELVLIYDPTNPLDTKQARAARQHSNFAAIREITIPFSGHSPSYFLRETGDLSRFMDHVLRGDDAFEPERRWSRLRQSKTFLFSLSEHADRLHRRRLASLSAARAVSVDPHNAGLRHHYSAMLSKSGRDDEAVRQAQRAVELSPQSPTMHHQLSALLDRCGHADAAIVHASCATKLDSADARFHHQLAALLHKRGLRDAALAHARTAHGLAPRSPDISHLLSVLLFETGDDQAAESVARQTVEHAPAHADAHHLLSVLLHGREKGAAAVQHARQAVRYAADNPQYLHQLGMLLDSLGKQAEAIDAALQAARLAPDEADIRHLAAMLLYKADRRDEALAHSRAAVLSAPGNPDIDHLYRRLTTPAR